MKNENPFIRLECAEQKIPEEIRIKVINAVKNRI